MKPTILVTGRDGQLGSELQLLHFSYPQYHWVFVDRDEMDLSSKDSIDAVFEEYKPAYFISCGAYTAVDKAETDREMAEKINATAVGIIADNCKNNDTVLIHISTDYVFDGNGKTPYKPDEPTDPLNYYGLTKRDGEVLAFEKNPKTIVIRTAWVYSSFGANFVKTMLRLMSERDEISVVSDQVGTPTYARDLAKAIIKIIVKDNKIYGTYHFANEGIISWYDFAEEIKNIAGLTCRVNAIPSSQFPTPAKRPFYSVLDKTKIVEDYDIVLKDWKESLRNCMQILAPVT